MIGSVCKDGNVPTQYAAGTASDHVCLDVMLTATDFANTKSITMMCRHT